MKIATKVRAGYAALIALMVAVVAYQISLIHRMQSINKDLSQISFRAAMISIRLGQDLDQIEEYAEKFLAIKDPEYAARSKEWGDSFSSGLQELMALNLSSQERAEVERLARAWAGFEPSSEPEDIQGLKSMFGRLRDQVQLVIKATQRAIGSEVERSARMGQRAEWVSRAATAVALILSLLVSLFITRTISKPLKQLTDGTKAIAEGKFDYQLDASQGDEFAELARDFNIMAERLGELDQMKRDFISYVSHELKSPLASIEETTHLLLEQIPGSLTDKQRRLLELNLQSCKRLSSMIDKLLEMSRIEAGIVAYELARQDLAGLARISASEFEARARERGLRLEVHLPPEPLPIVCDGDRILHVFGNLLENALKFSPRGGAISIDLRLAADIPAGVPNSWRDKIAPSQAGFALISVSDCGPGVPDQHKEKIFQKFHQVGRGKQGVGLGLAICRTIVEAHRGAIWVEDRPGGGSTFCVLLPAAPAEQPSYV
jgi:signal transduction histidine kinase